MSKNSRRPGFSSRHLPVVMGLCAGLAVVVTLDGPGLTIDEPLDVRPGRTYLESSSHQRLAFLRSPGGRSGFSGQRRASAAGPLAAGNRLGAGRAVRGALEGPDPTGHYVLAGRLAPALAFAALVGLLAFEAGRRWGPAAGAAAAFALVAMPRVFAHAHLAALDTFLSLFWTLALVAGERAVQSKRPCSGHGRRGRAMGPRALDQDPRLVLAADPGLLVVRPAAATAGARCHGVWAVVGISLFWAGLALALVRYLDRGSRRSGARASCGQRSWSQYFGQVVADRDVPWHYPWFYFAATVPVGLQALGALGIVAGLEEPPDEPFPLLLAGHDRHLPGLFSTRVPVYDGERLFLHVFPAWALLIGTGFWLALGPSRRDSAGTRLADVVRRHPESTASLRCIRSDSAITMAWSADCPARSGSGSS